MEMFVLLVLGGAAVIMWVVVALIAYEISQRRKEREFAARLRKIGNTVYSTSESGVIVQYDVNIEDYPSNIIEIGRGSR